MDDKQLGRLISPSSGSTAIYKLTEGFSFRVKVASDLNLFSLLPSSFLSLNNTYDKGEPKK